MIYFVKQILSIHFMLDLDCGMPAILVSSEIAVTTEMLTSALIYFNCLTNNQSISDEI